MDEDKVEPVKKFRISSEQLPEHFLQFCDNIAPPNMLPALPAIILSKPDPLHVLMPQGEEIDRNKIAKKGWIDRSIPVEDQGLHKSCWTMSCPANISDARSIHRLDSKYTRYSGPFLTDFVNPRKALEAFKFTDGEHYCYGHSSFDGLKFIMNNGIPLESDWTGVGCGKDFITRSLKDVRVRHVLNDVRLFTDVNIAAEYLKTQPIIGSIAVFSPDLADIEKRIYRGPVSTHSKFAAWHSISIRSIFIENGETIAFIKNSHGVDRGNGGYFKASLDVLIADVTTPPGKKFASPSGLIRSYCYGEVREEYEKKVAQCYACGQDMGPTKLTLPEEALNLIFEGIYHNTTSGRVCHYEDGDQVIGDPVDRALFKWAIQQQEDSGITYKKSDSTTTKGKSVRVDRSKLRSSPTVGARGIAVDYLKGIHIHWKGKAAFILANCTFYYSDGELKPMSEAMRCTFGEKIKKMDGEDLISIAFAFKFFESNDLPDKKIPFEELVFLALFGIEAVSEFEDEVGDPSLDDLVDLVDSCPSNTQGLDLEFTDDPTTPTASRVPVPPSLAWRCGEMAYGFDLDFNNNPPTEVRSEWGGDYDIELYGRIGLQCHNLHKGTNFRFNRWEKYGTMMGAYLGFYITLEATDPATGSVFSFQTLLSDIGRRSSLGVRISWVTLASRIKPIRNEPLDEYWCKDTPAIHEHYKGPLPKWFPPDEALACDSKKYYVVPESELHDNDWLQLLMEVAFFSKADRCLDAYLPLELNSVVVETFEDYTTEAREKLKANNAIFYLSYKCCTHPSSVALSGYPHSSTTLAGDHHAVVRKTMDGKPEHMRLEVSLTKKQEKE
ncbi:hypothetical protein N665_0858s0021 [Sinapis alba]|nr:hypothetical protein N665_0858s0021 [Sinapis alba]